MVTDPGKMDSREGVTLLDYFVEYIEFIILLYHYYLKLLLTKFVLAALSSSRSLAVCWSVRLSVCHLVLVVGNRWLVKK